jgi:hypothetical protein
MTALESRSRLSLEILALGAVGGIAGDQLLRAMPWGLNITVCTAGFVAATAWLIRRYRLTVGPDAPWLAITALLLSAAFLRRDAQVLMTFDAFALILTLCLGAASLQRETIAGWRLFDYVRAGVTTAFGTIAGSVLLVSQDVKWRDVPMEGRWRHARAVLLGVIIATPLLLIFAALFASADQVFGNVLQNLFAFDVESVISHTFLFGFWAALSAGYLRWSLLAQPMRTPADLGNVHVGIVPVATVLALLNALFLLFVVVQLRYFFGGASLVEETTGLTYAVYARRGFMELVTASALVLPILLVGDHVVRGSAPGHVAVFRRLAGLLLALLAVIMASAFERMRLYVAAFGLTEDRLYATAFMLLLLGVFAWFCWTVLRGSRQRFAFGVLMQGLGILAGLHLLNPDAFILRTNLNRPAAERPFDAAYAVRLGADAVPLLVDALPRLDTSDRCTVASKLLKRWHDRKLDWRSWNWSRSRAVHLVSQHKAELSAIALQPACKAAEPKRS